MGALRSILNEQLLRVYYYWMGLSRWKLSRRPKRLKSRSKKGKKKRASKKRVHNKLNLQYSTPPTLSDQDSLSSSLTNSPERVEMISLLQEEPQVPNLRIQVTPPDLPPIVPHKTVPDQRSLFQQDFLTLDR